MKLSERYAAHVDQWKDCVLCPLCSIRRRTVFSRGNLPADVLFIGEAPGPSEDSLGKPFVGPAGKVLDLILEKTLESLPQETLIGGVVRHPRFCITNATLCYPGRDSKGTIKAPGKEAIKACNPRLVEFVELVSPKLIVRLGNVAKSATKELVENYPIRSMIHPSAINYMDDIQMQHITVERCVARLTSWIIETCTLPTRKKS